MKVALIHDQLQEFGGAERVLVTLKKLFPEADVYTSFFSPESLGIHKHHFDGWNIITTWADKVPFLKKLYSPFRFITPLLWESINLNQYDLVLSSSGSYMCKGVITRPETVHICYLHHQPRYLYYYETAIEWQKYWPIKVYGNIINHDLRQWDYLSSQRVDFFIANSKETLSRIKKFYRRDGDVIYPPVAIPNTSSVSEKVTATKNHYITVSRLARAKHIETLIHTANRYGIHLKIVGTGRDESFLRSISGATIEFLGSLKDNELENAYKEAKAFLFSSVDEEFGIAPVEAMGHGVPVIAYASGGLIETIKEGKNGYLFHTQETTDVYEKIALLEGINQKEYRRLCEGARSEAEKYTEDQFEKHLKTLITNVMKEKH